MNKWSKMSRTAKTKSIE